MLELTDLNVILTNTWNWLGVNKAEFSVNLPKTSKYIDKKLVINENGVLVKDIKEAQKEVSKLPIMPDIGVSEKLYNLITKNHNSGYFIDVEQGENIKKPIVLDYSLCNKNAVLLDDLVIVARENSQVTVVVKYASIEGAEIFHNGLSRIYAEKGAKVHLVKVQMLSDTSMNTDAIGVDVAKDAVVRVTLLELGADKSATSCKMNLLGNESSGFIDSLYLGNKKREIDINYLLTHQGKKTNSQIDVRGVLLDESKKTFRGTLDFKKGSSASKGSEEEYTVLLSPKVRNRSVPILLCGEDDVEGQHSASTGKLDEEKLFYLMSRGLSEIEAKKLVVEASFQPILDKIPVDDLRQTVVDYIRRRVEYG